MGYGLQGCIISYLDLSYTYKMYYLCNTFILINLSFHSLFQPL